MSKSMTSWFEAQYGHLLSMRRLLMIGYLGTSVAAAESFQGGTTESAMKHGHTPASPVSDGADFLQTHCQSNVYFARYMRVSSHPALIIFADPEAEPCVLIKLSCRLIANVDSVTVFDDGRGTRRAPIMDGIVGEIVLNKLLAMSSRARASLPASSGVIIRNLNRHFLAKDQIANVPTTCFWNTNTVTGIAFSFIPDLVQLHLTTEILSQTAEINWDSLGTILLADTLSNGKDRSSEHNLFHARGKIWSIDLPMNLHSLLLLDHGESKRAISHQLKHPHIFQEMELGMVSIPYKTRLWNATLAILLELCGGFPHSHCLHTMAHLSAALRQDPHLQFRQAFAKTDNFIRVLCDAEKHERASGLARTFAKCQTPFQEFLDLAEVHGVEVPLDRAIDNITTVINTNLLTIFTQLKWLVTIEGE